MKLQRTLAAVLGGAMLCTTFAFAAPLVAAQPQMQQAEPAGRSVQEPLILPERMLYYGRITERLTDQTGQLTGLRMESERYGEFVFHIDAQTLLLDSGAGVPADAAELTAGKGVYVFHSAAVTMSLPPQAYAEAIAWNMPQDAGVAKLHTVEQIERHADGSLTVTTDRGGLRLRLTGKTTYLPFGTRQIVTAEDVHVGSRLFAWYTAVQESDPARTEAVRVALLPAAAQNELPVSVDGKALDVTAKTINGTLMVPASAVGNALGFAAQYAVQDGEECVTLRNDQTDMQLVIGQDSYVVEGDMVMTFGAPAVIEAPGVTWMPAEALAKLADAALSLADGTVAFRTAK